MSPGYRVELDGSPELDAEHTSYYQGLVGVLQWLCELGRVDILVATSMLARYLMMPHEGHLEQAFHVFAYLKVHDHSMLVFDQPEPMFEDSRFRKADWSEFYPGAEESIPPNAPKPQGKPVVTSCFVDADHAGCRLTHHSHSGILLFVNRAPVMWYSK